MLEQEQARSLITCNKFNHITWNYESRCFLPPQQTITITMNQGLVPKIGIVPPPWCFFSFHFFRQSLQQLIGLQTEVMPWDSWCLTSCLSDWETPQLSQPLPSLDHMHISWGKDGVAWSWSSKLAVVTWLDWASRIRWHRGVKWITCTESTFYFNKNMLIWSLSRRPHQEG